MKRQEQDTAGLARRFLEDVWASRWESCRDRLGERAVYEDPLLEDPVTGRDPIIDTFKLCHAWGILSPVLKNVFASGSMAAAEFQVKGRVKAALLGMPESAVGKSFDFPECDVFEFDGSGRIVRMTIYADVAGFMKQVGMLPGSNGEGVKEAGSR